MRCGAFCVCIGYLPKLLSFWRICTPRRWLRLGWGGPGTGVLGGQRGAPGLHYGAPAVQRIHGLCGEAGLGKHATGFWGVSAISGRQQPAFLGIPGSEPYAGAYCIVALCRRHGVFLCSPRQLGADSVVHGCRCKAIERQIDSRGECPQGPGTGCLCPVFDRVVEQTFGAKGQSASVQHLCDAALCEWCRDLERDAISTTVVGIGIQQLLEGDHECAGFRPAQFAAHLENLLGQVVGLLACTMTIALAGARGSNAKGQVSPRCAHCAVDERYFWP
ncbi:unnamed protein product [Sphagnum jensenii]|uniref:Uncharacterized protein n=1 Tax=Sphagnum jensenii TaxID=128206 RepID=A0ABP1B3V8_9BRYO